MSDSRDEDLHADRAYRPGPPPELREPPPRRSRALGVFVATFALAGFAAVVWYAYDQGLQRGSEATAPLIKADTTPTKVRPEQPGGLQVPNQDKLVYDAMRPGTSAEPKVERLLPPPERPVTPPPPPPPPAPSAGAAVPPVVAAAPQAIEPGIPPARIVTPAPTHRIPAPGDAAAPQAEPRPDPVPAPPPVAAPAPPPAPPPSPVVTPVPAAPPPAPAPAPERPAPVAAPAPAPPPAAAPAPGGFRIQVGALRDEAAADAEWSRLQKRYPAELAGLQHRTQRVDLGPGKGVFFRIQSSGVSEASAAAICAGLKAKGQPCIVVKP